MLIGVDMVEINDVRKLIKYENGLKKIFTENELNILKESNQHLIAKHLAGRFAVKEAVVKALGTGFTDGITFKDIETVNVGSGKPLLYLYGRAKEIAESMDINDYSVSISYSRQNALAMVVLK